MEENQRFRLAKTFKELRDRKQMLEAEIKGINQEMDSIQAELVRDLIDNESTGFNYQGYNFTLVIKEYPSAEPERKDELYKVMKEQGF